MCCAGCWATALAPALFGESHVTAQPDVRFKYDDRQTLDSDQRAEDRTAKQWDRILNVNLMSYFLMSKFALPEIRQRGGSAVINTASVQGLQSQRRLPAYAASKGGVLS